jgi:hypothetical protein
MRVILRTLFLAAVLGAFGIQDAYAICQRCITQADGNAMCETISEYQSGATMSSCVVLETIAGVTLWARRRGQNATTPAVAAIRLAPVPAIAVMT